MPHNKDPGRKPILPLHNSCESNRNYRDLMALKSDQADELDYCPRPALEQLRIRSETLP